MWPSIAAARATTAAERAKSARSAVYRVRSVLDAPAERTTETPFGSRSPTDAVDDTEPDDAKVSAAPRKPNTRTMTSDAVRYRSTEVIRVGESTSWLA
jgi:hypothetical protein